MFKGWFAWFSPSSCWNVIARLLEDDEESADYESSADDESALADVDYDDDGVSVTELLVSAQDGLRADSVLSILRKNPGLIRIADPARDTVLHVAARAGDIDTMCKLMAFMKARPDLKRVLTDTNLDGDTPLHVAVKNRHKEVAYHLAKAQGCQLTYILNNDGKSAPQLAKKAGYKEVCKLIRRVPIPYKSGIVDVEISAVKMDLMGMSKPAPVHWMEIYEAIQEREENTLATVLMTVRDGKKLLWYQGDYGKTLLHEAATLSGDGLLRQLIQFMISNDLTDAALLKDDWGNTALHSAVYENQMSQALDLIKVAPRAAYQVNNIGESPLYLAVENNYHDLVMNIFKMLSPSFIPANASDILFHPKNATLAHLAIKSGNLGILQTVMEHLPELINKTDKRGWRPLSYAANIGHLEAINHLLTNFPNSVEKVDRDGSLPIHKAVAGGKVSIIKAFLSHCSPALHHVDIQGRSVLHIAVRYARTDILDYLNKNIKMDDSFLNLKDNQGKTCIDYAKPNRFTRLLFSYFS